MEDNPSLINPTPTMRQMLERTKTKLIYEGPLQKPLHIPASWSPEDQRDARVEWWENGAHRWRKAGEWAAAQQCFQKAASACRVSSRGRREGSGRFGDAEDFRTTVVNDLRALRRQGIKNTQLELARFWYQNDHDPTAEVGSLVTEIKRYCRR
jgi:hypothetical protein